MLELGRRKDVSDEMVSLAGEAVSLEPRSYIPHYVLGSVLVREGKLEQAREYLLVIKTVSERLKKLEREVHRLHTYDVPEFIVVPIIAGSAKYL